jgi:hypothetical protein
LRLHLFSQVTNHLLHFCLIAVAGSTSEAQVFLKIRDGGFVIPSFPEYQSTVIEGARVIGS